VNWYGFLFLLSVFIVPVEREHSQHLSLRCVFWRAIDAVRIRVFFTYLLVACHE
jgi:hypothetical protein